MGVAAVQAGTFMNSFLRNLMNSKVSDNEMVGGDMPGIVGALEYISFRSSTYYES